MTLREEPCDLGGTRFVVEGPADLTKLGASLSRLVTPRARALFTQYPGSLLARASETTFGPLARWLR